MREEGTPYSDIDLIVFYEKVANPWRESFVFDGFPVEAFIHDIETANYFIQAVDAKDGKPVLATMISEGIVIPGETGLAAGIRKLSRDHIAAGPSEWGKQDAETWRYFLTDLMDDIRQPRNDAELTASGTVLYDKLANFYLRSRRLWGAASKSIPRRLKAESPEFFEEFQSAFEELFVGKLPGRVIRLTESVLAPHGGRFFSGLKVDAPVDFRKKVE